MLFDVGSKRPRNAIYVSGHLPSVSMTRGRDFTCLTQINKLAKEITLHDILQGLEIQASADDLANSIIQLAEDAVFNDLEEQGRAATTSDDFPNNH